MYNHIRSKMLGSMRDFSTSHDGVVAVIVALAFVPMLIFSGAAVDIGRAYIAERQLLAAADAAGLAIAAAIDEDSTDAELETILDNYIDANFDDGSIATIDSQSFTYEDSIVTVSIDATISTSFMVLANIDSLEVGASSQVTRSEETLEVVLVLDNSGSMAGSKLTALKDASDSLLDVFFGADLTSNQVKIGLVPFSNNVNIGATNTAYVTDTTIYDWGISSWAGCPMAEIAGDEDTKDDFVGPWTPFYWPDDGNNNWDSGGYLYDTSTRSPNKYCPDATITPLTNVKATLTDAIDDMVAYGGTHINWGAIWGWRVVSPSEPFAEGVAYGTTDNTKAVILLTDGANTAYDFVFDAFGYPADELLGSGIDTAAEVEDEIDDRLETTCTNMKSAGIIVYTITFDLSDFDTIQMFRDCATDTDKYYDSPTNAELTRTFRSIAAELKQLHVIN